MWRQDGAHTWTWRSEVGFRDATKAAGNLPPKVQRANDTVDAGVEVLAKAHERGLPVIVEAPPSNASGEHAIEGRFRQRAGTHSSLN